MNIAVMGCVRTLPSDFPISKPENSGNMIHGEAPFRILPGAVAAADAGFYKARGYGSFADYVNAECSHLVITLANTLRMGVESLPNLDRMSDLLEKIKRPVVTFGLGGQSQTDSIDEQFLAPEAVRLVRTIADRSNVLGVRGELTAEIVKKKAGISNVFVTGCPSVFSRPEGIRSLRESLRNIQGRPSFNGTKLHQSLEKKLLRDAIDRDHFLVEPVNRFNHGYHVAVNAGVTDPEVPYFLRGYVKKQELKEERVSSYYRSNYRLFRAVDDWLSFNTESVSYTYGTRFHVNMASILSGVPAMWLTHDARTRELADYMNLPSSTIEDFGAGDDARIEWDKEYENFLAGFEGIRSRFAEYLRLNGLTDQYVRRELFN